MATTITANGINFPDGSAGSPSIGGSDTNTGLFTGADIIGFSTGGSERLRIDSSGNVGIGTTSPSSKLSVVEAASTNSAHIKMGTNTNQNTHLELENDGSADIRFGCFGSSANTFGNITANNGFIHTTNDLSINAASSTGNIKIGTGATPSTKLFVKNDGNVGIGTTSPQSILSLKVSASRQLDVIKDSGDDHLVLKSTAPDASYNMRSIELAGSDVSFSTGASSGTSYTESMRIDGNGNVGIGTTSPQNMIHTSAANDSSGIRMTNTYDTPDNVWALLPAISGVSNTGFCIRDVTDGVNRLVIDGSGNVGINQTTPSRARLHVVGDDTDGDIVAKFKSGSGANSTAFIALISGYSDTANDLEGHAYIGAQRAGSGNNSRLLFQTYGGGSSLSTRMTISEGGNIGAPSGTNIYNASDERLKKNVVDIDKGLSAINSLRPVSFNWIDGFCDEEKETLYGFIAQEVQAVDTNLIQNFSQELTVKDNTINDVLRVNEKFIIPMLVKAVQELTAKVEALEAG